MSLIGSIQSGRFQDVMDLVSTPNFRAHEHVDTEGNTPLHYAAQIGNEKLVQILCGHFPVNHENAMHQTPMHWAAEAGHKLVIQKLRKRGATLDAPAKYQLGNYQLQNITPVMLAIIKGKADCICEFIESGNAIDSDAIVNIEQISPMPLNFNIIHIAVLSNQITVLKQLLTTHYPKTKRKIKAEGFTPLMLAAFLGNTNAIRALRSKRLFLERRDSHQKTALFWAIIGQQEKAIKQLRKYGCNIDSLDNQGKRAIDHLRDAPTANQSLVNSLSNSSIKQREPVSITNPEILVFQGGGPKGIAYVDVVKGLEDRNKLSQVREVAGTSAGAIMAVLIAVGYSADEIAEILKERDLSSFLDNPKCPEVIQAGKAIFSSSSWSGIVSSLKKIFDAVVPSHERPSWWQTVSHPFQAFEEVIAKLNNISGLCSGENFRIWIEELIFRKTGLRHCTFGQLHDRINEGKGLKELHVFTTSLKDKKPMHINSLSRKWRNVVISDAIRASISLPLVYEPHRLYRRDEHGDRRPLEEYGEQVDGGLVCNYPIEYFRKNRYRSIFSSKSDRDEQSLDVRVLGFSLYSPQQHSPPTLTLPNTQNMKLSEICQAIMNIYYCAEDLFLAIHPENAKQTVRINNQGVDLTDFNLSDEMKYRLRKAGKDAIDVHFKEFDERYIDNIPQEPTEVNLAGRGCVMDAVLQRLAERCQNLKVIDVSRTSVTPAGIRLLAWSCPNLERLSISKGLLSGSVPIHANRAKREAVIALAQYCEHVVIVEDGQINNDANRQLTKLRASRDYDSKEMVAKVYRAILKKDDNELTHLLLQLDDNSNIKQIFRYIIGAVKGIANVHEQIPENYVPFLLEEGLVHIELLIERIFKGNPQYHNAIYGKVYELGYQPLVEDRCGEKRAWDNLPLLADALQKMKPKDRILLIE